MQPNREVQQKVFSSCPQIIRKETVSFIMKLSRSLIIIFLFLAFFCIPSNKRRLLSYAHFLFLLIYRSLHFLSLSVNFYFLLIKGKRLRNQIEHE